MHALKAHVKNGRIVVDEPTDLPEGTELEVMVPKLSELELAEWDQAWTEEIHKREAAEAENELLGPEHSWSAVRARIVTGLER